MEMICVPAGAFSMGEGDDRHVVYVATFYIAKYPVTNAVYQSFVVTTGHRTPSHWRNGGPPEILSDHPVVNVSWSDALTYCRWMSETTGHRFRLPTEAEWEKAARGTDGRIYPWGNVFDHVHCNCWEAGIGWTTPVDWYENGASPYGVMDMGGNVWEWCSSLYVDYPYRADDGREELTSEGWRALRGGAWLDSAWGLRAARRLSGQPDSVSHNTGFRVVREV